MKNASIVLLIIVFLVGCSTTSSQKTSVGTSQQQETQKDVTDVVGAVADAVSKPQTRAKYCPVCGRHYSYRLIVCPQDSTQLKDLEE